MSTEEEGERREKGVEKREKREGRREKGNIHQYDKREIIKLLQLRPTTYNLEPTTYNLEPTTYNLQLTIPP